MSHFINILCWVSVFAVLVVILLRMGTIFHHISLWWVAHSLRKTLNTMKRTDKKIDKVTREIQEMTKEPEVNVTKETDNDGLS